MEEEVNIKTLIKHVCSISNSVLNRVFGETRAYPIDVNAIAEDFNLPVYYKKLDEKLAGCFFFENGGGAIVVNRADNGPRQRFTIGHELGHFISYYIQEKEGDIYDERGTLAMLGKDPEEIFANKFAAEILMPESEFIKKMESLNGNREEMQILSDYFGVSRQAIGIRIKALYMR